MDYTKCVNNIVNFIEHHLSENLTLESLAKEASFSPYHFHRIFQSFVGVSVMEYVRMRRLSCAAIRLIESNQRVIDVALDYGFHSHESFTRAFKKAYGLSPIQYRNAPIKPKPLIYYSNYQLKKTKGGIVMQAKIVTKPKMYVIGYSLQTTVAEERNKLDIPMFWQTYFKEELFTTFGETVNPQIELGICTDYHSDNGQFTYMIAKEVTEKPSELPEGMTFRTFPETQFAVFTTPPASEGNFSSTIQSTWDDIIQNWIPSSEYEQCGEYEYELYDERCHNKENKQIDIYIPIQKRASKKVTSDTF